MNQEVTLDQFARDLNDHAVAIRKEGGVPRFHNEFETLISGLPHTFEYDGYFKYAEVVDGLVKIHLADFTYKFRIDQLVDAVVE